MASLTGQSIASSYEQLLHTDADGGGNSTTLVNIKDGDNGTTFGIQLSTNMIKATGNLDVGDTSTHGLGGLSDVDHILTVSNHEDTSSGAFLAISGDQSGSDANVSHLSFCNNSQSASSQYKRIAEISARRVDEDTSGQLDFTTWNAGTGVSALRLQKTGIVELNQGQLKFPATQNASADANTLDDYEESSWTPAWTQGFSATNYNFQHGKYVKVGGMVSVFGCIGMTASGTTATSDPLRMELPLTAVSGMNNFVGTAVVQSGAALDTESAYIRCGTAGGADATAFFVGQADAADGQQAINGDDIGTSGTINFQITYQTT